MIYNMIVKFSIEGRLSLKKKLIRLIGSHTYNTTRCYCLCWCQKCIRANNGVAIHYRVVAACPVMYSTRGVPGNSYRYIAIGSEFIKRSLILKHDCWTQYFAHSMVKCKIEKGMPLKKAFSTIVLVCQHT